MASSIKWQAIWIVSRKIECHCVRHLVWHMPMVSMQLPMKWASMRWALFIFPQWGLIYLSVDIHAWNHLIWFNFSFQKDCVAKLELETLFANISLEIMCGVLMGVINVALRYVGKFWILCAWYLLRFFFRLLFVHSSMRSSFHWYLSYCVILIRI